jgi:hypothetical protein
MSITDNINEIDMINKFPRTKELMKEWTLWKFDIVNNSQVLYGQGDDRFICDRALYYKGVYCILRDINTDKYALYYSGKEENVEINELSYYPVIRFETVEEVVDNLVGMWYSYFVNLGIIPRAVFT